MSGIYLSYEDDTNYFSGDDQINEQKFPAHWRHMIGRVDMVVFKDVDIFL